MLGFVDKEVYGRQTEKQPFALVADAFLNIPLYLCSNDSRLVGEFC